ncbi:MAG: hypothetical protein ABSC00_08830 [Acidimicrobiales bacterium]|jgi:hypothetical protein
MPEINEVTGEMTRIARETAYLAVGLGVLGLHRAQVRRQELMKHLAEPRGHGSEHLQAARGEITKRVKVVDQAVEQVIGRVEASLKPIEDRLPTQARDLVEQVHARSREAREQLRNVVRGMAA